MEVVQVAQQNGTTRYQVDSELRKDIRRDLARAVVENGWGLLELQSVTMSLEDIFLKLTTAEDAGGEVPAPAAVAVNE